MSTTSKTRKEIIQRPKGTQDIFGPEGERWEYVESLCRKQLQDAGYQEIRTPVFESTELFERGVGVGTLDGEAVLLDPPLRFKTRPHALRVLIAPQHPGASPSARMPTGPWAGIRGLARAATVGTLQD